MEANFKEKGQITNNIYYLSTLENKWILTHSYTITHTIHTFQTLPKSEFNDVLSILTTFNTQSTIYDAVNLKYETIFDQFISDLT